MKGSGFQGKINNVSAKGTPGTGVLATLILGANIDLWIPWAVAGLLGAPLRDG